MFPIRLENSVEGVLNALKSSEIPYVFIYGYSLELHRI